MWKSRSCDQVAPSRHGGRSHNNTEPSSSSASNKRFEPASQPRGKVKAAKAKQPQPQPMRPPEPPPRDKVPYSFRAVARIWIVRHGETRENVEGIVQGTLDTALNEAGLYQAELVAEELSTVPFSIAAASNLKRASKTAEIIVSKHPELELQILPALRERYCGERQGMAHHEYIAKKAQIKDRGEDDKTFSSRIFAFWDSIIKDTLPSWAEAHLESQDPIDVLLVSHSAFIVSLIRDLVSLKRVLNPAQYRTNHCDNTSVSMIELDKDGLGVLVHHNDMRHADRWLAQREQNKARARINPDAESVPAKRGSGRATPTTEPPTSV